MIRRLFIMAACFGLAWAQQNATVSGLIKVDSEMSEGTRVAVHVVDQDNAWQREVASSVPVGGTFSVTATPVPADELLPFRNGAVLLPGLQNEYTVSPEDAHFAQGRVNVYIDTNGNGVFDRLSDAFYVGVQVLEAPVGFFKLIYVDKDVTISGKGVDLPLKAGWNVFSIRLPDEADPSYTVSPEVTDAVLNIYLP